MTGLGYIPDDPSDGDAPITELLGASAPLPPYIDYSARVREVRHQSHTSACVGFALSYAIDVRASLMGLGAKKTSPVAIYTLARSLDRSSEPGRLQDVGSRPRVATEAAARWGLVPEELWPFDEAGINQELPLDIFAYSVGHRLGGYYRIDGRGEWRSQHVRLSLAAGYPVCMGISVTKDFDETNGEDFVPAPSGPSRGGHYVCAVGYRPGAILVVNSWGLNWGRNGFAWLSDARVEHETTTDLQATTVVPT